MACVILAVQGVSSFYSEWFISHGVYWVLCVRGRSHTRFRCVGSGIAAVVKLVFTSELGALARNRD
eukprot:4013356-Pleurochrysis_carterae.AAC.1